MTIQLDHTIVPSRDKVAAAKRLAELLGVDWAPSGLGPFAPVYVNDGLTFDFIDTDEDFPIYHFCFRVSDDEFDAILGRINAAGIEYRSTVHGPVDMQIDTQFGGRGLYWNEPDGHYWEMLTVSYAGPRDEPAESSRHDQLLGRTPMRLPLHFRLDDLSGAPTRALVARHLADMYANSPACSVHALDVDRLRASEVTFWSVWIGEEIAGCCALKRLDANRGELKSMRVADAFRGRGVGRAMLEHLLREARERGMVSVWLETGSAAAFIPAIRLYESGGFVRCGPFDGYTDDPFSVFMTRTI